MRGPGGRKNNLPIGIALFLALASGCGQQYACKTNPIVIGTVSEPDTREAVLNASGRLIQALMSENTAAIRELISEQMGFQAVANGQTYAAGPFLKAIGDRRFPIPSSDKATITPPEFALGANGEATVIYRGEGQLIEGGKPLRPGAFVIRTFWINEGGTWRVTRIEQSAEGKRGGDIGW